MNILITGAKGMVGTALTANFKNIWDNKNRTRPNLAPGGNFPIDNIYERHKRGQAPLRIRT